MEFWTRYDYGSTDYESRLSRARPGLHYWRFTHRLGQPDCEIPGGDSPLLDGGRGLWKRRRPKGATEVNSIIRGLLGVSSIRHWLIRKMPLTPEARPTMRQMLKEALKEHQMHVVTALPKGPPYTELAAHAVASTMTDDEFRRRLDAVIDAMDDDTLKETYIRVFRWVPSP